MTDPSHRELVEAWRRATDADVARALGELADYPACVQGLIQQEAERRGVTADTAVNEGELPTKLLIRKIADLAELPWRLRPYTNPNNYWRYLRGAMGGLSARTSTGRQATSGTH
ncbi:MAG: hypothetical protein HYR83_09955 [Planctomycetes bacterium]|nr:hypothetical protein [Planctomycetota bacterium]